MKKTIILLFALFATCVTSFASFFDNERSEESEYNKLVELNRSFKMTGGTDIVSFANALSKYLPFDNSEAETIDKANGYIHVYFEGDGMYDVDYAVWKCSDGKRLYIVSYYITDPIFDASSPNPREGNCSETHYSGIVNLSEEDDFHAVVNAGYQAYLYNANTKMLEPIKFPVDKMKKPGNGVIPAYILILPKKGKNIDGRIGIPGKQEKFRLLWNGKNGFICQ